MYWRVDILVISITIGWSHRWHGKNNWQTGEYQNWEPMHGSDLGVCWSMSTFGIDCFCNRLPCADYFLRRRCIRFPAATAEPSFAHAQSLLRTLHKLLSGRVMNSSSSSTSSLLSRRLTRGVTYGACVAKAFFTGVTTPSRLVVTAVGRGPPRWRRARSPL